METKRMIRMHMKTFRWRLFPEINMIVSSNKNQRATHQRTDIRLTVSILTGFILLCIFIFFSYKQETNHVLYFKK